MKHYTTLQPKDEQQIEKEKSFLESIDPAKIEFGYINKGGIQFVHKNGYWQKLKGKFKFHMNKK